MKPTFSSRAFRHSTSGDSTKQYSDHQVVYTQGEAATAMFRVQRGHVKLTAAGSRTRKAVTAILSAGDCFGEGCLATDARRMATATSVKRSTVNRLSRRNMITQLRDPALSRLFISHLLHRVGRVEDDLVSQLVNSSERRLARLLLQLAAFGKRPGRTPAVISVDQGTLAQVVGTTRSRVSFFMNRFRKKGFIDYNGDLRVHKALLTFLKTEPPLG